MKAIYYISNYLYNILPPVYFKKKFKELTAFENDCDKDEINFRLQYYLHNKHQFIIPSTTLPIAYFKKTKGTGYYLDFKEFLHFFKSHTTFVYEFGDSTEMPLIPTIKKARKIGDDANTVLFKLNKNRHFQWVNDKIPFENKINKMVWRGGAYLEPRLSFIKKLWNHPKCNAGQTNKPKENVPWQKSFLSKKEQLAYKFIFCPEGNDVATNLKWAMSSNSLVFMPKPTKETWFMEGILKPGIHYVEIDPLLNNLDDKIEYYSTHINEAILIIKAANQHVSRFKNKKLEDLLCLKVLQRYAQYSGQCDVNAFK